VVIALIVEAGWSIGGRVLRSPLAIVLAVMAFAAGALKINTLWVLLGAGAVGLLMIRSHSDPPEQSGDDT
jgi:chromate transport protein ChrA